MNTLSVKCCGCQQEINASRMRDGTYLMLCTALGCRKRGWSYVMVGECEHCTAPITAYEQERLPQSKAPRLFMATCWNRNCKRHGHTVTRTLETAKS